MFAGLEAIHVSPSRRWPAMLSFGAQAAIVAVALIIPLLRPAKSTGSVRAKANLPANRKWIRTPASEPHCRPLWGAGASDSTYRHPEQNSNIGTEEPQTPILSFGPRGPGDDVGNSISNLLARPVPRPTRVALRPVGRS
jgi:hypothetical protein